MPTKFLTFIAQLIIMPSFIEQCLLEAANGSKGNNGKKKKYGVHLNEMKKLASVKDPYDCAEDIGPSPAIAEEAAEPGKPELYTTLQLPSGMALDINRMGYDLVMPGYTVIIYGPRRSGKSHFIKALCQRLRPYYPNVVVFTRTKASCEYHSYVPDSCIIDGLDEDVLMALIGAQEHWKIKESNGEDVGNRNLLIILDDILSEKLRYKDIFNMVFFLGRHWDISFIVSVQDVKAIAPAATANCDVMFTFPLTERRYMDTIREKFAGYLDRDDFDYMMESPEINKKYHMLGFAVSRRYNDINKRVYFGCVDPGKSEEFVMGDRDLWEFDMEQLLELGHENLAKKKDWGILK